MNKRKTFIFLFLLIPSLLFCLESFNIKIVQDNGSENYRYSKDFAISDNSHKTSLESVDIKTEEEEEEELELEGTWQYSYDLYNNTVTISGDRIMNNRTDGISGSLLLTLYFTSSKYYGGSIYGYEIGEASFDVLEAGSYYYNIDEYLNIKSRPVLGTYYVTLILSEYNGYEYQIVDYVNFDGITSIY